MTITCKQLCQRPPVACKQSVMKQDVWIQRPRTGGVCFCFVSATEFCSQGTGGRSPPDTCRIQDIRPVNIYILVLTNTTISPMKFSTLFVMETKASIPMCVFNIWMKSSGPFLSFWRNRIIFWLYLLSRASFFLNLAGIWKPGYIKTMDFIYSQRDREICDFSTSVSFYSCLIPFHYSHTLMSISATFKIKVNKAVGVL